MEKFVIKNMIPRSRFNRKYRFNSRKKKNMEKFVIKNMIPRSRFNRKYRFNSRKKKKIRWFDWDRNDALIARAKLIQFGYNTTMDPDWFVIYRVKILGF
jgi:hypothetical protein